MAALSEYISASESQVCKFIPKQLTDLEEKEREYLGRGSGKKNSSKKNESLEKLRKSLFSPSG